VLFSKEENYDEILESVELEKYIARIESYQPIKNGSTLDFFRLLFSRSSQTVNNNGNVTNINI